MQKHLKFSSVKFHPEKINLRSEKCESKLKKKFERLERLCSLKAFDSSSLLSSFLNCFYFMMKCKQGLSWFIQWKGKFEDITSGNQERKIGNGKH